MGRSPCCDKNGLKKGPWTPEEDQKNGYGNLRTLPKKAGRVIVPETPKPTMAAQNPDPTPTWISCNHCSQRFIRSQNVRGVVVQDRDPNARYYVADNIPAMFPVRPKNGQITSRGIRGANQVTNLTMTTVFCLICREPAGWRVLKQSQSHPTVNVGKFLQPVPPPQP